MGDLRDRHIMVTGGSRGIGAATAVLAAERGADVTILYRAREDAARAVVEEVERHGRRAQAIRADVGDEGETDRAFAQAGSLDGLVHSAGIFEGAPVREMSLEFWERTMRVNLTSTFLAVRAATRQMERGSVVLLTSTAGQRGSADYSAYATSKGGQILFMRSMAKELAPAIRVNCVAPSWTETDMADASLTALGREDVAKGFPLGRIGQAQDVARAAVFLLSDESSFVTGMTLTVDGGADMRG